MQAVKDALSYLSNQPGQKRKKTWRTGGHIGLLLAALQCCDCQTANCLTSLLHSCVECEMLHHHELRGFSVSLHEVHQLLENVIRKIHLHFQISVILVRCLLPCRTVNPHAHLQKDLCFFCITSKLVLVQCDSSNAQWATSMRWMV